MWRRALSLATAVPLLVVAAAPGQDAAAGEARTARQASAGEPRAAVGIPIGERVRLSLAGMRVEGQVSDSDDVGLTIVQRNGVSYRAARESLDAIELSRPRPRLVGALRGGLIAGGVMAGMSAAFLVGQQEKPDGTCTDAYGMPQVCATSGQVASDAAVGAAMGAVIGALWPGRRWERVQLDQVRVSVVPAPGGGVAARASLRF